MLSKLKEFFISIKSGLPNNVMMIFFTKNFRIIFLSVSLLSLCILSVYSASVYNSVNSENNSQLQSLLNQTASGADNIFESSITTIENLSQDQNLFFVMNTNNIAQPFNYASTLGSLMKTLAMHNSTIDSICVYSVKNDLFLSTDYAVQQWFSAPQPTAEQNRANDMYVQTKLNDFPAVITIYRSVFDTAGKNYLGYIAVNINTLTLEKNLSASFTGLDMHIYVIHNNTIVYSDIYDAIGSSASENSALKNSAAPDKAGNNKKCVSFECSSQINSLKYIMLDYNHSQRESLLLTLRSSLIVGLIIFILSIIVSLILSAKIYVPYKNIIKILQNDNDMLLPTNYLTDLELIESYVRHYTQSNSILSNVVSKQSAEIHQLTLASLQAQIHPHFIYNIIDCICWSLYEEGLSNSNIHKALLSLANLMKMSYDYSSSFISVSEESDFLTNYTNLLLFKYYNSFNVDINFEPSILKCVIPKMILQPIVENAFNHGICKTGRIGCISISGRKDSEDLIFSVTDSGPGIENYKLKKINETLRNANAPMPKEHIGLYNISKRLRLIYGSKASIELSARSGGSSGLSVTVRIPIISNK